MSLDPKSRCCVCGVTLAEAGALFRDNQQDTELRCEKHLTSRQREIKYRLLKGVHDDVAKHP